MGRLVLLEFDDNQDAELFMQEADFFAEGRKPLCRVVGVFIKPGQLCECSPRPEKHFRGSKFGLWACYTCKKPMSGCVHYLRDLNSKVKAKHRMLHISVRFQMKNGKVEVIRDDRS